MAREPRKQQFEKESDGFESKLINVNRVTKVVKGGRTMRFSALVVAGDMNGQVGIGTGKAGEVPEAIRKATADAKRNLIKVAMVDTTVPHEAMGEAGAGLVKVMPAEQGAGVIAGGPVRAVMEMAGIKDVRAKSIGSNNPTNCVRAALDALSQMRTKEEIAALRGKKVEEL